MQMEYGKYIIRKGVRVDITNCFWCSTNETAVCAGCCAKADAAVASLREDREAQQSLADLEQSRDAV
jgi:hypothetical protein